MIARVLVHLPFHVTVPRDWSFLPSLHQDDGLTIRILPPVKSNVPDSNRDHVEVTMEGHPAVQADLLRLDFIRESFNRKQGSPCDPPEATIRKTVNAFLWRFRRVADAPQIRPLDFPEVTWRLKYLKDDGTMFQPEEGLVRGHGGLKFEVKILGITEAVWTDVREPVLDDTPPWEGLLLDARSLLPRIGPALVLAATALEVLISWVLDRLAERGPIPKELWTWINERGDYQREPSVEEQFGAILRICGGWSLKTDPKLWEAFKNLKAARNTFVHEGVAKIGKDLVDVKRASELVNGAMRIVVRTWEQLPDDLRWPRFSHTVQFQVAMPLALPAGVVLLDEA